MPELIGGEKAGFHGQAKVSWLHNGVLFLDELPEFPRNVQSKACGNRSNRAP